ncbi:CHASE3 domain-containing protein [Paenibacillus koleovorans]|uniref:CHASE3 domain-containing protein n=1 Tax=Paenibacillus koleovorans TaxID=121608 RepID=UPI000FDB087D|nr:CHASE3 domain-containing protein [Paenibacillus koleovorans]
MRKRRKVSIRTKMMLGYIFVILCLGSTIALVMDRVAARQEAIDYITEHDLEMHELLSQMEKTVVDMETGQRGFIITGDERYLEPYQEGRSQWLLLYNRLHDLLADSPRQQRNLEDIKPVMDHWLSTAGEATIQLKRQNKSAELLDFFRTDPGKRDIDDMRSKLQTIRESTNAMTVERVESLSHDFEQLKGQLLAILLAVAAVSLLLAFLISGSIVTTIRHVSQAIRSIASSSRGSGLAERIQVTTNDEIRELAETTNGLLAKLEVENWVQSGLTEVATSSQGIHTASELADHVMEQLTPMLGASYGAVYLKGGQPEYGMMASYAVQEKDFVVTRFKPGEGLIGQAAVNRRVMHVKEVPGNYVKVYSGLGESAPRELLIVPILFEGRVEAVLEFASFEPFGEKHLTLVEQLQGSLGTAFNSVLGRMEIERLLNESQMMTEELQAQSEELQAQSEELQMQQEQLRISNEFLEEHNQFVEQKAAELKKAKDELEMYSHELERSSQYKSDFLANMSHELRTPLNSILILSQLLSENEERRLSREEEEYSRVIFTAGQDLLTLINDILDLSKLEAGKLEIAADEVNLTELPQLLKPAFDPVANRKGLTFEVEVAPDVPNMMVTDGQRLQQILRNLLSNAFKFTEQGTVALRLYKVDAAEVEASLDVEDDDLVIAFSIIDTGIGIPKEKQQLIFEAFQQADGTTSRQYGGTGLGLSISREFSRLLGGCMTVVSVPGKGSTFTLLLPELKAGRGGESARREIAATLALPDVAAPPWAAGGVAPAAGVLPAAARDGAAAGGDAAANKAGDTGLFAGRRVLLVDDDERNVFALVTALASKGMAVEAAAHGREAVELLRAGNEYDIVLMDIMMPVMDGYEAMRAIRSELGLLELPIIALTAKAMKNARDQCLDAGANDYISKPLNTDQLYSLMRVWLTKQVNG